MTATIPPAESSGYDWLLDRINEAYRVNPQASLADGLQHALDCLDERFGEQEP